MVPESRLATRSFRAEENQENALVRFVAGAGMGYGAPIAPFLLLSEATAMRATCVQMCHAIERRPGWPTPVAVNQLVLCRNAIGNAGATALAALLQVRPAAVIHLELRHNAIGNAGAAALAALLRVRFFSLRAGACGYGYHRLLQLSMVLLRLQSNNAVRLLNVPFEFLCRSLALA